MIEPIRKNSTKANRQFTDRDPFLEIFHNALKNKKNDEYKVLVYYGVGGIGKTSLQNEIKAYLKKHNDELIWERIDFSQPTKELNLKNKEDALIFLRNSFKKNFGIEFPTYEIAYAFYLKKVNSKFTFSTDKFQFLEEGSIVADILSVFGGELSFVSLPFKFIDLFELGKRKYEQWYASRGKEDLMALEDLDDPDEIMDNLHIYFAQDLSEYLTKKGTYEELWETNSTEAYDNTKDQCIRDLIQQLPEVLGYLWS